MKDKPHLSLAHAYWRSHLQPGDCAIDATIGNGHDIALLARLLLSHPDSVLVGLDIQSAALQQTGARLQSFLPEDHLARVLLHRCCHSHLDTLPLPQAPRLIVYNLGYLPGHDKALTTQTATTIQSLEAACRLLSSDGALSITCYPGHAEGAVEAQAVSAWAAALPSSDWLVCHHQWINRKDAPSLLWIKKKADKNNSFY